MAQAPRGELTGRVVSNDGQALPGVTITVNSPNLQGTRTTIAGEGGAYKLAFLPAGPYDVTYVLDGFNTVVTTTLISADQTRVNDVSLEVSAVTEEIIVSGSVDRISETSEVAVTWDMEEIDALPIGRNLTNVVQLTPGVFATGPSASGSVRGGGIVMSGAMSFENLWMVNGIVINDNVRGQPLDLFIEDAIQEQTVRTAGISAEFGRFQGGVVNVLTKSGGNQFHGSLRTSLTNEDWQSATDLTTLQEDSINETYEGTLGGRFMTDKIWFFVAGRDLSRSEQEQTTFTNIAFPATREQDRVEAKLTISPTASHTIVGSYLEIGDTSTGAIRANVISVDATTDRADPQDITAYSYNGVLTSNFFLEAQYSERNFSIGVGSGGPQDRILGSPIRDFNNTFWWFSPFSCGGCETEVRNNENQVIKGSYFLATESAGAHDISFGYDTFNDEIFDINHQSGSDYHIWSDDVLIDPNTSEAFPVISNTSGISWIAWWPVFNLDIARPTDFNTNSFFVNDSWQLNDKWSFNIGVRYDENDGSDAGGNKVADDENISPRLSLSYDVKGDGDMVINASFGTYTALLSNTRADATSEGGALGRAFSVYSDAAGTTFGSTPINLDSACLVRGDCVTSQQAIETMFAWYDANGGPPNDSSRLGETPNLVFPIIPGSSVVIPTTIDSPNAEDLTVGITKRIGTRGIIRADLVYRDFGDFYADQTSPESGQVEVNGVLFDRTWVGNFDRDLKREYMGIHTHFRYRFSERLNVQAIYSLSKTEGNFVGEFGGGGPLAGDPFEYSEFKQTNWNLSDGDLPSDQRHKIRAWAIYSIFNTDHHGLTVSWLENFASGQPYGAAGSVATLDDAVNPGYLTPPPQVDYWFEERDTFHTDDIHASDLSFNYAFKWKSRGKPMEIFIQPEILNIFDEGGVIDLNTAAVEDAVSPGTGSYQHFNPFTETPVQGTHYGFGPNFGQPESEFDFQTPRTYRVSVGFRF